MNFGGGVSPLCYPAEDHKIFGDQGQINFEIYRVDDPGELSPLACAYARAGGVEDR